MIRPFLLFVLFKRRLICLWKRAGVRQKKSGVVGKIEVKEPSTTRWESVASKRDRHVIMIMMILIMTTQAKTEKEQFLLTAIRRLALVWLLPISICALPPERGWEESRGRHTHAHTRAPYLSSFGALPKSSQSEKVNHQACGVWPQTARPAAVGVMLMWRWVHHGGRTRSSSALAPQSGFATVCADQMMEITGVHSAKLMVHLAQLKSSCWIGALRKFV